MAQTKRKRRSKHRGTAAGTIESRGRTGRPPTAEERKKQTRISAKEKRLNTPPTWKAAATRALLACAILFAFLLVTTKGKNGLGLAVSFAVFALVIYIPAGYYLELFLYRRRQAKREATSAVKTTASQKTTNDSKTTTSNETPTRKQSPTRKKSPK